LGNLKAEGTYWEPVRFKPINVTEYEETRGTIMTRYGRSICWPSSLSADCGHFRSRRRSQWLAFLKIVKDTFNRNA
uniref:Transposase n=1 Tax=Gongylonema pulchrum TaxID=637853 RepID=A0A183DGV2_9BILA